MTLLEIVKMSFIDKNADQVIDEVIFENKTFSLTRSKSEHASPMTFDIYGDFTIYNNFTANKSVRFEVDGIDEEVELLEVTNEKIKIKTSHETSKRIFNSMELFAGYSVIPRGGLELSIANKHQIQYIALLLNEYERFK